MTIKKASSTFLVLGLLGFAIQVTAQKLPSKKDMLSVMKQANSYFMDKWPDPGKEIVTNIARPSNIWTRAVYYEGLMALYKILPDRRYYEYAVQWAESHNWGLRNGPGTRNADNQCCGQTYIELYLLEKKHRPDRIRDIKLSIDSMVNSDKNDDWNWVDALQMSMPVFARLAVLYDDPAYLQKMFKLYNHAKTVHGTRGLYNPEENLWWRDKDFVPPYKEPNGEDCYWSRGNGWVFAALVRVLDIIPKTAPHRDEYLKTFNEMARALLPLQRPDGFWNVSLHDSTNFGGKELTGTALFAYGMAWGINKGLLSRKTYMPVVVKAWNAITKEGVRKDGSLAFVQGTGKQPSDGQPVSYTSTPDFEDFGLGCFLLAGTEVFRLRK